MSTKHFQDVAEMVHDIKNPLSAIFMSVDFLKRGCSGEKDVFEFYDIIEKSSKEILLMINSILKESDTKEESFNKSSVFVATSNAIKSLNPLLLKNNISINETVPKDLNTSIPETKLNQIILNLLSNSIKYNKKNGAIKITAHKKDSFLILEIQDTGIGIAQEELSKIFDKFYRSNSVNNSEVEGTGLGLYIIKNILNSCGGDVFVSSKINEGSKFTLTLPT